MFGRTVQKNNHNRVRFDLNKRMLKKNNAEIKFLDLLEVVSCKLTTSSLVISVFEMQTCEPTGYRNKIPDM